MDDKPDRFIYPDSFNQCKIADLNELTNRSINRNILFLVLHDLDHVDGVKDLDKIFPRLGYLCICRIKKIDSLDSFGTFETLQKLSIMNCNVTSLDLSHVAPNLTKLYLDRTGITSMKSISFVKSLKDFEFDYHGKIGVDSINYLYENAPKLNSLSLFPVDTEDWLVNKHQFIDKNFIDEIPVNETITRFDVSKCNLDSIKNLHKKMPNLEHLSFSRCTFLDEDPFKDIDEMKHLKSIYFQKNSHSKNGYGIEFQYQIGDKKFPSLEKIIPRYRYFSEED